MSDQTPNQSLSPELSAWHQRGTLEQINGHDIFVIDEGNKDLPVIVLIHGFPTCSWDFEQIWPVLREQHRVISLDMLGFGFSDKPDQRNYTIHKQADLFDAVLASRKIQRFHILAHDYGVSVAQELLVRHTNGEDPQALSCCFLNGGLFPETHKALLIQKLLLGRFGRLINSMTGYSQFKKSFSKVFGKETKPSELELSNFWQAINYKQGKYLFYNLITYMNDRIEHRERWLAPLQKSDIPLALINGPVDPVSGQHLVKRYNELGCRLDYLKSLDGIGHYPQCEAPERVSAAYLDFLSTCKDKSPSLWW